MNPSNYDFWKLASEEDYDPEDSGRELEDLLDLDSRLSEQADRDNDLLDWENNF